MSVRFIETTSRFDRGLGKLPIDIQRETTIRVALFKDNPFNKSLKTHKLKGKLAGLWSFSITRSYRILFRFLSNDSVIFYDIGDHRIYR